MTPCPHCHIADVFAYAKQIVDGIAQCGVCGTWVDKHGSEAKGPVEHVGKFGWALTSDKRAQ